VTARSRAAAGPGVAGARAGPGAAPARWSRQSVRGLANSPAL